MANSNKPVQFLYYLVVLVNELDRNTSQIHSAYSTHTYGGQVLKGKKSPDRSQHKS